MNCSKDHSGSLPRARIEVLATSQRDFWRHKCAACAYEVGRADGARAEAALRQRVRTLESQLEALTAKLAGRA